MLSVLKRMYQLKDGTKFTEIKYQTVSGTHWNHTLPMLITNMSMKFNNLIFSSNLYNKFGLMSEVNICISTGSVTKLKEDMGIRELMFIYGKVQICDARGCYTYIESNNTSTSIIMVARLIIYPQVYLGWHLAIVVPMSMT